MSCLWNDIIIYLILPQLLGFQFFSVIKNGTLWIFVLLLDWWAIYGFRFEKSWGLSNCKKSWREFWGVECLWRQLCMRTITQSFFPVRDTCWGKKTSLGRTLAWPEGQLRVLSRWVSPSHFVADAWQYFWATDGHFTWFIQSRLT